MSQSNSQENTGRSSQINEHIQQLIGLSKVIENTSNSLAKSVGGQFFQPEQNFQPEQTVKQQSSIYGSIGFEIDQDV